MGAPNNDRLLLGPLANAGTDTDEDTDRGSSVEYRASPIKVSHTSRTISIAGGAAESEMRARKGERCDWKGEDGSMGGRILKRER